MGLGDEADKDCFATNISGCFHFVKKLTSVPKIEVDRLHFPPPLARIEQRADTDSYPLQHPTFMNLASYGESADGGGRGHGRTHEDEREPTIVLF
jgi:hypothetical protein